MPIVGVVKHRGILYEYRTTTPVYIKRFEWYLLFLKHLLERYFIAAGHPNMFIGSSVYSCIVIEQGAVPIPNK